MHKLTANLKVLIIYNFLPLPPGLKIKMLKFFLIEKAVAENVIELKKLKKLFYFNTFCANIITEISKSFQKYFLKNLLHW